MDVRIPPLDINIMLESNPPKSRILVWRLAVVCDVLECRSRVGRLGRGARRARAMPRAMCRAMPSVMPVAMRSWLGGGNVRTIVSLRLLRHDAVTQGMCVYIYIYIYIYRDVYTHIYIYIYVYIIWQPPSGQADKEASSQPKRAAR